MGSAPKLFTAAALFVLAGVAPALAGDILVTTSGSKMGNSKASDPPKTEDFEKSTLEVIDEQLDVVTYRLEGVPQAQSQPMAGIRTIYHDPAATPPDLLKGRDLIERGDAAAARDCLARVAKDGNAEPWAKQEAAYRIALSWAAQGKPDEAEKQFAAFKSANPKSRWVREATDGRAKSLLSLDKIDEAKKEFGALKTLSGVSEADAVLADYYVIWIDEQVGTKRNDQAALAGVLKGYDGLISKLSGKASLEAVLRKCQAGRASCLIALGKPAEAKELLEKLVPEIKEPAGRAAIYNKLGLATWRCAPTDKAQQRAALFHFLRVITLYGDAPGADDDRAEAGFHAGELFKELKAENPDYMARARREWNDVIALFPGSVWATRSNQAKSDR